MRNRTLGLALSAALVFSGASAAAAASNDTWITTKAKISLLTADGVSGTKIDVDTVDGKVTLHGKVNTAAEKAKAESTVKAIEGVKEVKNLLQVVPEDRKDIVDATDESIEGAVERALEKLAAGTYGTCERCGRPSAPERLDALPWATLCIDCKQGTGR